MIDIDIPEEEGGDGVLIASSAPPPLTGSSV